jgi:peptidoglycan/LPS O-acetylase OafA/YrhL
MAAPIPVNNTKLYGLDHLRALAITLVFMFHYGRLFPSPAWLTALCKFGWTGVDLFFVLSGYLISSHLFAEVARTGHISLRTFFIKRFFRIIPAYLVVVAIYFCISYAREREALAPLWKYLTFTQNLGLDIRTQRTFSHAWSLCIEEQFYLCLPLILALLLYFKALKKGVIILICLFLLGFIIRYYSYQSFVLPLINSADGSGAAWYQWIYYPTYTRLDGLLAGVSIATLFQYLPLLRQRITKYGNALILLSLAMLTAAYFLCIDQDSFAASVFGFPLVDVGYGVMVIGAISPGSVLYKFSSRITTRIAVLSYSVYLVHKFTIHITQDQFTHLGIKADSTFMLLLCVTTSLLVALIMNKLVEKPFLKLRNKILSSYHSTSE